MRKDLLIAVFNCNQVAVIDSVLGWSLDVTRGQGGCRAQWTRAELGRGGVHAGGAVICAACLWAAQFECCC